MTSISYGNYEKVYSRDVVLFASGDSGVGAGNCKDGSGNVRFTTTTTTTPSSQPLHVQAVSTFLQNLGNRPVQLHRPWIFFGGTEYESFGTSGSAPVSLFLTPSYYLVRRFITNTGGGRVYLAGRSAFVTAYVKRACQCIDEEIVEQAACRRWSAISVAL
ncbi:hypothetical protein EDB83DRAFT_2528783 [Lactarius deliciosus]|nr:hypothetical protein EDB83DRAFT_2528783 [Lactarius deliciosus]